MKKKIYTAIIIILLILLFVQLYYYNHPNNPSLKETINEVTTSQTKREIENATTQIETINDNYSLLYNSYNGTIRETELEDFINDMIDNKKFSEIFYAIQGNSESWMRRYYDVNTKKVNDWNIYSADDLLKIYSQLNKVVWSKDPICVSRNIDMNSIKNNGDYTTFTINIVFSNTNKMDIVVSLANSENVEHKIMISG